MQIRARVLGCLVAASLGLASPAPAAGTADDSDVAALRKEIEAMKRDYEARLRALEERVQAAEGRAVGVAKLPAEGAAPQASGSAAANSDGATETVQVKATAPPDSATAPNAYTSLVRAFNPQISAILQGRGSYFSGGRSDRSIPGFQAGGETGRGPRGLALGESELVFSANVDDKLYGFFDVSFDQDEIGIEEAYLTTLSLPAGFGLKGGQFLSAIGYQNGRHSHTWDFVDQPLAYESMLGGSLSDAGLQVSWIAPTDLYVELGGEVLGGDGFPAAGRANKGFGSATLFGKLSGDVGDSHSWMAGLSYLRAESDGRLSDNGNGSTLSFDGKNHLAIVDFVWKWSPLGNFHERNFTFQTEYLHRNERGRITANATTGDFRGRQDGFYVQGVYQFMPRWRAGVRYGQLWTANHVPGMPATTLDRDGASPRRISTMLDFSNSEFSRLRLQYSYEAGGLGNDSLIYLQYIISIGSHGAHAF